MRLRLKTLSYVCMILRYQLTNHKKLKISMSQNVQFLDQVIGTSWKGVCMLFSWSISSVTPDSYRKFTIQDLLLTPLLSRAQSRKSVFSAFAPCGLDRSLIGWDSQRFQWSQDVILVICVWGMKRQIVLNSSQLGE